MGNKCCKCQSSAYSSVSGTVRSFSSYNSSSSAAGRSGGNHAITFGPAARGDSLTTLAAMKSSSGDRSDVGGDYRGGSSSTVCQEDPIPVFLRRLNDLNVRVGARTRFLIELDDATGVQVRWYHNNVEVYCDRYQYIHEGGFFCLDIVPVTLEDEGLWVCTAQNYAGKTSTAAHLSLTVPKAFKKPIFVEPLRAVLTQRGIVSLECKVIGVPTPKLRWYKDEKEIKAGDIFALTANSDDDCLGIYTCEATNVMGTAVSTSKIQVAHERPDGKWNIDSLIPYGPPPKFVKGLKDTTGKVGNVLFLECQVEVPPWPQNVGWYNEMGTVNDGHLYRLFSDGLGMYGVEIKSLRADHNTTWKCVATSSMGAKAVSSCSVTVTHPKNYRVPRFLESLRAIMTDEGLVSFECKVIGYPTPELSWFKDGNQLQPGDVYELTGSKSLGTYCCVAQNCMGEASSVAELTIEDIESQLNESEKLQLTSNTQPPRFLLGLKSTEANINESLVFTVKVKTESVPSISWYREDEELIESNRYRFSNEENGMFVLNIAPLEIEDQAEWKCVAVNKYGQTVTSCFLKLNVPKNFKSPRFLDELRIAFSNEGSVNLECKVIGVPQPQLKWFKDGQELNPGDMHKIISGQSGTCCLGTYTCQAHNCMGTVSSSATLLTMEDKSTVKSGASEDYLSVGNPLVRNESLSTIPEERTSQMEKSYTIEEPADISFSFDGKEVTVSLYETPDLTHDEALQIIEMYADELSEHISEDNVVDLPSLRIVKESSISGPIMMEALVIDVPIGFCQQQTTSDTEFDGLSLTEDKTFENNEKNDSVCENSLEYFSDHLSSSNSKKDVFFSASETSPKRLSLVSKQRSEDDGHPSFHTPKLFMSNSDDQMLTQLNLNEKQHTPQNVVEKLARSESNNTEEEVSESLAEIENELPLPQKYCTAEILTQSDDDGLYSTVLNKIQNMGVSALPLSLEEDDVLKIIPQTNVDEFLKYMKIILEGTMVKMHTHERSNYAETPTELERSIQALHSLAWKFIEETERENKSELDRETANNVSNLMTAINASLLALEQIDDPFGVSDNVLNEIQSSVCFDLETLNNKELSATEILDRLSDQIKNFTLVVNSQVAKITEQRIISVIQNTISTTLLYIKTLQQNCSKIKCVNVNSLGPLFSMVQPLETILNDIALNEEKSIDETKPDLKLKQMLIPPISSIAFSLDNLSKELKNENPEDDLDLKDIYDRINDSANQFMALASQGTESNNIAECFISFTKPINDLCCHLKKIGRSTENIVSSDYGSDDKLLLDFETLFDELMMDIDTLINNVNVVRDSENNINPLGSLLEPLQDIKIGFFQVNQVILSNQAGSNMSFEVINCFEHLSHQLVQLNNCIVNQSIVEETNKELPFETSIKMMQNILFNDAIDDLGVNGILFGSVMKPLLQLQNLIVSKMASVESDLSFSEHTDATGAGASQSLSLSLSNNAQTVFDKANNDNLNLDIANPSLIDNFDKINENNNLLRETTSKVSEDFIPVEKNKRNELDIKRGHECDIGAAFKYEEPNIITSEDDQENSGFEVLFDETDLETASDFVEDEYLDSDMYPIANNNSSNLLVNEENINSAVTENYANIPENVLELLERNNKHDLLLNSSLDLFDELQETLKNISEMTLDTTKELNSLDGNSLEINNSLNNASENVNDLDGETIKSLNKTLDFNQVKNLTPTLCNESMSQELKSSDSNMSINGEKCFNSNREETVEETESMSETKTLNVDQNDQCSEMNCQADSLDSDKTSSNITIITNVDASVEDNICQTESMIEKKKDDLNLKNQNETIDQVTVDNSKTDKLIENIDSSFNVLNFSQDGNVPKESDNKCVDVVSDNDVIKNQIVGSSDDFNVEFKQNQTEVDNLKSDTNLIDNEPDNLDTMSHINKNVIENSKHKLELDDKAQTDIESQDDEDKEKNVVSVKDVDLSLNESITNKTGQLTSNLINDKNDLQSLQKIDLNEVPDNKLVSENIEEQNDLSVSNLIDHNVEVITQNCFKENAGQPSIVEIENSNSKINSSTGNTQNLTKDEDFQANDQEPCILNETITDENLLINDNEVINTEPLIIVDNNLIGTKNYSQESDLSKSSNVEVISNVIPYGEIPDDSNDNEILNSNVDSKIIDGQIKQMDDEISKNVLGNDVMSKLLNSELKENLETKLSSEENVKLVEDNNIMEVDLVESKNNTIDELKPTPESILIEEPLYTDEVKNTKLETESSKSVNEFNESVKNLKHAMYVDDDNETGENICQMVPTFHKESVEKVDNIFMTSNEMNNALVNNEVVTAESIQLIDPCEFDENQVKTILYEDENRENANCEKIIILENSNGNNINLELSEDKEDLICSVTIVTDIDENQSLVGINDTKKDEITVSNDISTNVVESNDAIAVNITESLKKSDRDLENSEEKQSESQKVKLLETGIKEEKGFETQKNQKNCAHIQSDVNDLTNDLTFDGDKKEDLNTILSKSIETNHPESTEEKSCFGNSETTDICKNLKEKNMNSSEISEDKIIINSEIPSENKIVVLENETNKPLTELKKMENDTEQGQLLGDKDSPEINKLSNDNIENHSDDQTYSNPVDEDNADVFTAENTENNECLVPVLLKDDSKKSIFVVNEFSTSENYDGFDETASVLDDNKNKPVGRQGEVKIEEFIAISNEENMVIESTQVLKPIIMETKKLDNELTEPLLDSMDNIEISVLESTTNIDKNTEEFNNCERSTDGIEDEFTQAKTNEIVTNSTNKLLHEQENENPKILNNTENHTIDLSKTECSPTESNVDIAVNVEAEIVNEPANETLNVSDNINNANQQKSFSKTGKSDVSDLNKEEEHENLNTEATKESKLNQPESEKDNKTRQPIDDYIFEKNANLEDSLIPEEEITDLSVIENTSTLTVKPKLHRVEQIAVNKTECTLLENINILKQDDFNMETFIKHADVKHELNIAVIGNIVNDYDSVIENTQNECNNKNIIENVLIGNVDEYKNEIVQENVDVLLAPKQISIDKEESEKTLNELKKTSSISMNDSLNDQKENSNQLSPKDEITQVNENTANIELKDHLNDDNLNFKEDPKKEVNEKCVQLNNKANQIAEPLTTLTDIIEELKRTENIHNEEPTCNLNEVKRTNEDKKTKENKDQVVVVHKDKNTNTIKNERVESSSDDNESKSKITTSEEDKLLKVENMNTPIIESDISAKEKSVEEVQERNVEKNDLQQSDIKLPSPDNSVKEIAEDHENIQQMKTKNKIYFPDDETTLKTSLSNELKNESKEIQDEQNSERNIKQTTTEREKNNLDDNTINNLKQAKIEMNEKNEINNSSSEVFDKETNLDETKTKKRGSRKKKSLEKIDKKSLSPDKSAKENGKHNEIIEKTEIKSETNVIDVEISSTTKTTNLSNDVSNETQEIKDEKNMKQTEINKSKLDSDKMNNLKEQHIETNESKDKNKTESELFDKDKSFEENDNQKRGSKKKKSSKKSPSPDKSTNNYDKDHQINEQNDKKTETSITDDKIPSKTTLSNDVKNEIKEIKDEKNINQTEINESKLDNDKINNLKEQNIETNESKDKNKTETELFDKEKSFEENDDQKRGSKKKKSSKKSPSPDKSTNKKDTDNEMNNVLNEKKLESHITDDKTSLKTNLLNGVKNETQEIKDEQNIKETQIINEPKLENDKTNNLKEEKIEMNEDKDKRKTESELFDKEKSLDENDNQKRGSKKKKSSKKADKKSSSPEKSANKKETDNEMNNVLNEKKLESHITDDKTSLKTNLLNDVKNETQEIKDEQNIKETQIINESKLENDKINNLKKEKIEINEDKDKSKIESELFDKEKSLDENDNQKRGSKKKKSSKKAEKKSSSPDKSPNKKDTDGEIDVQNEKKPESTITDDNISLKTNLSNEVKNESQEIKDQQNLEENMNQTEIKEPELDHIKVHKTKEEKIETNETNERRKMKSEVLDKDKSHNENDNQKRGSKKNKSSKKVDKKSPSPDKSTKKNDKISLNADLPDENNARVEEKDDLHKKLNTEVKEIINVDRKEVVNKNENEPSNDEECLRENKENGQSKKKKNDLNLQNKKSSPPKTVTPVDDKTMAKENDTTSKGPETRIESRKSVTGVEESKNEIRKSLKHDEFDLLSKSFVHPDVNEDVFRSKTPETRSRIKSNVPIEYETTKYDVKTLRSFDKPILLASEYSAVERIKCDRPDERETSYSRFSIDKREAFENAPTAMDRRALRPRVVIDTSFEQPSATRRRDLDAGSSPSCRRYLDVADAYCRTSVPLAFRSPTPEKCFADRYSCSSDREISRKCSSRSPSPYPVDSSRSSFTDLDSVYLRNRSLAPAYRCPSATTLRFYGWPTDDDFSSHPPPSSYGARRRTGSDGFLHASSARDSRAYCSSWRMSSYDRWLTDDLNRTKETFKRLYFCVRLVDQTVSSGSRVKLWCSVIGYPEPRVQWYREGQKLNSFSYNSSARYWTTYANGLAQLIVENAQSCDSGEYTCVASNGRDRTSTSGFLTVYTSPSTFGVVARRPSPSADIRRDRFYLWSSDDLWRREAAGAPGSGRPRFATGIIADDVATYGGTIALHVRVHGSPSPNVTWMRESRSLPRLSSKYVYLDEGGLFTLLVKDSTSRDGGTYVCRACNLYGTADVEKTVRIVSPQDYSEHRGVKPAIIVSRPNDRLNVAVGEDIVVTLRVAGEPKPKVIWMRGSRDVTFQDRSLKETVNDYVKLSIKKAQLSDAGTYFIIAKNVYGSDRAFVTVGVRHRARSLTPPRIRNATVRWSASTESCENHEVPGPVQSEPTITDRANNRITLSWEKPKTQVTVLVYNVEAQSTEEECWRQVGMTPTNYIDLYNLKPGYRYKFRVTARNRYGWGPPVDTLDYADVLEPKSLPYFHQQLPGETKILLHNSATLQCHVRGVPRPRVTWYKDGDPLPVRAGHHAVGYTDRGKCTLAIKDATDADAGRYACEAVNDQGRVCTFTVVEVMANRRVVEAERKLQGCLMKNNDFKESAPIFAKKLIDRRVEINSTVRLSCQVIGLPVPSILWYKDGHLLDFKGVQEPSRDSDNFSTLELIEVKYDDSGAYTAVASNSVGKASSSCTLEVFNKSRTDPAVPEFVFDLPPTLEAVDSIILSAQIDAFRPVKVEWFRDEVQLRNGRRVDIVTDHDGSLELRIVGVTKRDSGTYTLKVSNDTGTVESHCDVFVVDNKHDCSGLEQISLTNRLYSKKPKFVVKPKFQEIEEGREVVIDSEIVGDPLPKITWLRDGLKTEYYRDNSEFLCVADGNRYQLKIPHAKLAHTGTYALLAENPHGQIKALISLQVYSAGYCKKKVMENGTNRSTVERLPRISRGLVDIECCENDVVAFECKLNITQETDVKWKKDGKLVRFSKGIKSELVDGDTARLEISEVTPLHEGLYTCIAYNELGQDSTSARLSLSSSPKTKSAAPMNGQRKSSLGSPILAGEPNDRFSKRLKRSSAPKFYAVLHDKIADVGETVRFQCSVSGHPPPWSSWEKDGRPIGVNSRIRIREDDDHRSMEISDIEPDDAGIYRITVENKYGKIRATARLEVLSHHQTGGVQIASSTSGRRQSGSAACAGENFALGCDLRGNSMSDVTWYKNDEEVEPSDRLTTTRDALSARLTISNLELADTGVYTCVARCESGVTRCSAELSVFDAKMAKDSYLQPPIFVQGLVPKRTVEEGERVELTVKLQGAVPMSTKWFKDNVPIPDCGDFAYVEGEDGKFGLSIADPFNTDSGTYSCRVTNSFGEAISNGELIVKELLSEPSTPQETDVATEFNDRLNVKEKIASESGAVLQRSNGRSSDGTAAELAATILWGPCDTTVLRGARVVLESSYAGNPEPRVQWHRAGKTLESGGHLCIANVDGISSLTIDSITADDCGKYVVLVDNGLGNDYHFASVAVEGPPDPPAGRPVVAVSETSADVTWSSPAYDGGCMVTGYTVEVRPFNQSEWRVVADKCHSLSHIVRGLAPGESYIFRVRAENMHGLSDASLESIPVYILQTDYGNTVVPKKVNIENGELFTQQYELLDELGKGRYGVVYKVKERETSKYYAAKFVRCIKSKDKEKAQEEVDVMNCLRHPKLLQLDAAFEYPREVVMVTEYISGGELFERVVADDFTLTEKDCILFTRQICEGVDYMHRQNIVHLDLKPENIMCQSRTSHQIKLIDFGLAQKIQPEKPIRVLFGTPEFIPPEIISYEPIGLESDMWSVGVICYVLLSGLSPFMGDNDAETFTNITKAEFDFDDEAFDAISQDSKDFISALLIKRKEKRLTAKECLKHKWLAQQDMDMSCVILCTDKLKKFIIRRKWQEQPPAEAAAARSRRTG